MTHITARNEKICALLLQLEESIDGSEQLSSFIDGLSSEDRAQMCLTPFAEYPTFTPLISLIQFINNDEISYEISYEILEKLLIGLSLAQRLAACKFIIAGDSDTSSAFLAIFALSNTLQAQKVADLLLAGIKSQDIIQLLRQRVKFSNYDISIRAQFALENKFNHEPLRAIAANIGIDPAAFLAEAYETPLAEDFYFGFCTKFWQKRSNQMISLCNAEKIISGRKRFLYKALIHGINHSALKPDIINRLNQWLNQFTEAEKQQALHPPGLEVDAGNPF